MKISLLVLYIISITTGTSLLIPNCSQITDPTLCQNTDGCTMSLCQGDYNPFPSQCITFVDMASCQNSGCLWQGCSGSGPNWSCSDFFLNQTSCTAPTCTWNDTAGICSGIYIPTNCSNFPNRAMCLSATNCEWVNNQCMSCDPITMQCNDPIANFIGYRSCYQIHQSLCISTNGCSPSCTSNPSEACSSVSDAVTCTDLPGCFWRKNACFGAKLDIVPNCSLASLMYCENSGCTINQTTTCVNAPCNSIMNPDLCNQIFGCSWDTGFCYSEQGKFVFIVN